MPAKRKTMSAYFGNGSHLVPPPQQGKRRVKSEETPSDFTAPSLDVASNAPIPKSKVPNIVGPTQEEKRQQHLKLHQEATDAILKWTQKIDPKDKRRSPEAYDPTRGIAYDLFDVRGSNDIWETPLHEEVNRWLIQIGNEPKDQRIDTVLVFADWLEEQGLEHWATHIKRNIPKQMKFFPSFLISRKALMPIAPNVKELVEKQETYKRGGKEHSRRVCRDDGKRVPCPPKERNEQTERAVRRQEPAAYEKPQHEELHHDARNAPHRTDYKQIAERIKQEANKKGASKLGMDGLRKIATELGIKRTTGLRKAQLVDVITSAIISKGEQSPWNSAQGRLERIKLAEKGTGISFQDRIVNGLLALEIPRMAQKEEFDAFWDQIEKAKAGNADAQAAIKVRRERALQKLKGEIQGEQFDQNRISHVLQGLSDAGYGRVKLEELDFYLTEGTLGPQLQTTPEPEIAPKQRKPRKPKVTEEVWQPPNDDEVQKDPRKLNVDEKRYIEKTRKVTYEKRIQEIAQLEQASRRPFLQQVAEGILKDEQFRLNVESKLKIDYAQYDRAVEELTAAGPGQSRAAWREVIDDYTQKVFEAIAQNRLSPEITGPVLEKLSGQDSRAGFLTPRELVELVKKIKPQNASGEQRVSGVFIDPEKLKQPSPQKGLRVKSIPASPFVKRMKSLRGTNSKSWFSKKPETPEIPQEPEPPPTQEEKESDELWGGVGRMGRAITAMTAATALINNMAPEPEPKPEMPEKPIPIIQPIQNVTPVVPVPNTIPFKFRNRHPHQMELDEWRPAMIPRWKDKEEEDRRPLLKTVDDSVFGEVKVYEDGEGYSVEYPYYKIANRKRDNKEDMIENAWTFLHDVLGGNASDYEMQKVGPSPNGKKYKITFGKPKEEGKSLSGSPFVRRMKLLRNVSTKSWVSYNIKGPPEWHPSFPALGREPPLANTDEVEETPVNNLPTPPVPPDEPIPDEWTSEPAEIEEMEEPDGIHNPLEPAQPFVYEGKVRDIYNAFGEKLQQLEGDPEYNRVTYLPRFPQGSPVDMAKFVEGSLQHAKMEAEEWAEIYKQESQYGSKKTALEYYKEALKARKILNAIQPVAKEILDAAKAEFPPELNMNLVVELLNDPQGVEPLKDYLLENAHEVGITEDQIESIVYNAARIRTGGYEMWDILQQLWDYLHDQSYAYEEGKSLPSFLTGRKSIRPTPVSFKKVVGDLERQMKAIEPEEPEPLPTGDNGEQEPLAEVPSRVKPDYEGPAGDDRAWRNGFDVRVVWDMANQEDWEPLHDYLIETAQKNEFRDSDRFAKSAVQKLKNAWVSHANLKAILSDLQTHFRGTK